MIVTNRRLFNSIIQIHVMKSDSLETCTCGGLYCSTKPLPMGFTLPHTRLVHDHLMPLSCQRLGPPTTLTTWTSLLCVSLTNALECQDVTLLEFISHYIHYFITHEISPWNSHIIHMISHINFPPMLNTSNTIQNTSSYMNNHIHHVFKRNSANHRFNKRIKISLHHSHLG